MSIKQINIEYEFLQNWLLFTSGLTGLIFLTSHTFPKRPSIYSLQDTMEVFYCLETQRSVHKCSDFDLPPNTQDLWGRSNGLTGLDAGLQPDD